MSQEKQSQPKQTLDKIASKPTFTGFMNAAITQPTKQTEATRETEKKNFKNIPFIPKFTDSENLFPQTVAWLKKNSATNGAVLASKKSISKGTGFKYLKGDKEVKFDQIKSKEFLKNPSKESFYDISDLFDDQLSQFITHGEVFGVMKKVTVGNASSYTVKILDTTKCRLMRDGRLAVNPYWEYIKLNYSDEHYKKYTTFYNLWDFSGNMPNEFAFHYRRREDGYDHYGVPDYWAGAKDAVIEYLVDVYNNARLENGQFAQAYITFFGEPPNGQKPEEYLSDVYKKMGGAHNAGKPYMGIVSDKEAAPSITFDQTNNEGEFLALEKSAFDGIIRAHRWFPSLAGISQSGQLGSNQQIRTEYSIAISQVVPDYQQPMLKVLNKILELCEVDVQLEVVNKMPISFDDQIDPEMVMTMNEARKQLKLPPLPEDYMYQDSQGEYIGDALIIDARNRFNVAQRQKNGNN